MVWFLFCFSCLFGFFSLYSEGVNVSHRIINSMLKLELFLLRKFVFSLNQGLQQCQQESSFLMRSKLTFLINHCCSNQSYFFGVFLTLFTLRYLIRTFKYAKCLNNKRTNNQCDCISQLFCFSSFQLMLECPEDVYCFQFSPSDPNIIVGGCINGQVLILFKNKIGYFCIFLQYKK